MTTPPTVLDVVLYDGVEAIDIEVQHMVAIDMPTMRLRAKSWRAIGAQVFELWDARGDRVSTIRMPELKREVPLLWWIAECLRRTIASGNIREPRPLLGTSTVSVRLAGDKVYELSFGLCADTFDWEVRFCATGCSSLWDVMARILPKFPAGAAPSLNPWVLALDLEGTLISNAVSVFVRPGLYRFLACSRALVGRLVVFTSVSEARFREIAQILVDEGSAPGWFASAEYVDWAGSKKDFVFIEGADPNYTLLVDDMEQYVCDDQREQWLAIKTYDPLFEAADRELDRVLEVLARKTSDSFSGTHPLPADLG